MTIIKIPMAAMPDMALFLEKYRAALDAMRAAYARCEVSTSLEQRLAGSATEEVVAGHPAHALRCRLSSYFILANAGYSIRPSRTAVERAVCHRLVEQRKRSPANPLLTRDWLSSVAAATGGRPIRDAGVGTLPDRQGHQAVYPPLGDLDADLSALDAVCTRFGKAEPFATAIIISSLLLNRHPLEDGNGRLTRILFNMIVQTALGARFYLPLCELQDASAGGWTFAQRSAWMKGDWRPMMTFFRAAFQLFAR